MALMQAILERWPAEDVEVVTFSGDIPDGAPARRLYERCGFVCCDKTDPAPDGGRRDKFLLRR
jgi:hypothetical protein